MYKGSCEKKVSHHRHRSPIHWHSAVVSNLGDGRIKLLTSTRSALFGRGSKPHFGIRTASRFRAIVPCQDMSICATQHPFNCSRSQTLRAWMWRMSCDRQTGEDWYLASSAARCPLDRRRGGNAA